jgi:hypothetical protein
MGRSERKLAGIRPSNDGDGGGGDACSGSSKRQYNRDGRTLMEKREIQEHFDVRMY